jgi:hypothetical protein
LTSAAHPRIEPASFGTVAARFSAAPPIGTIFGAPLGGSEEPLGALFEFEDW